MNAEPAPGRLTEPVEAPGALGRGQGPKLLLRKLAIVFSAFAVSVGLGEVGLRLFCQHKLSLMQDEKSMLYRYDASLGWFPRASHRATGFGSRLFVTEHNSHGFRGPEPLPSNKPVIVFLGDSFVWGYDVDASERFTEKFQARHPNWTVLNLGISGYGTDQELLLLQQKFDTYRPRVVFLMFCTETDEEDNCSNVRYWGYYKPYYTVENDQPRLKGVPVPRSERAILSAHPLLAPSFIVRLLVRAYCKFTLPPELHNPSPTKALLRALQEYVTSKGAVLVVGLTCGNPPIEEELGHLKIPFVDVSTPLRYPDPSHGQHWTPEGHSFVCDRIDTFLTQGGYFKLAAGGH